MIKGLSGRSLGLKLILIGVLILVLGIPLLFVNVLTWERSGRAAEIIEEVGASLGGPQTVRGPLLIVPIEFPQTFMRETERGEEAITRTTRQDLVIAPQSLEISTQLDAELLTRAIYDIPSYKATVAMEGRFEPSVINDFLPDDGEVQWSQAQLVLAISDLRAFKAPVDMVIGQGETPLVFEPGSSLDPHASDWRGVTTNLPLDPDEGFSFAATVVVGGVESLTLVASGRDTIAEMVGDWPHPGFSGSFLPQVREVSDDGFTARWQVPYLARGVPEAWVDGQAGVFQRADRASFTVNLTNPADGYAQVSRSLKYAFFFLGFTVLSVFLLEAISGTRIHAAQYILIGLAQISFYVLLLAQSEHQSAGLAFVIAATATVIMTAAYSATALNDRRKGLIIFALMTLVYGLQYVLLIMENYALLIGAWLAFAALGVTMWVTRNIDWYGIQES
ncbi:cell envelope integrity protein CreD [Maricaulaceae bacterium NA33B04]|nr:cell envelope integrity protein CreD [Maricaulaceae bacterium NA33B04]